MFIIHWLKSLLMVWQLLQHKGVLCMWPLNVSQHVNIMWYHFQALSTFQLCSTKSCQFQWLLQKGTGWVLNLITSTSGSNPIHLIWLKYIYISIVSTISPSVITSSSHISSLDHTHQFLLRYLLWDVFTTIYRSSYFITDCWCARI